MKPLLIYYADDDIDDLNIFTEAAHFFGHETRSFFDGAALLAALSNTEKRPDLILLDYFMPPSDGLEILKSIRASEFKDIPVVMITGSCSINLQREFIGRGANYIISKPVNFKEHKYIIETLSNIDWRQFCFDVEVQTLD